jgi:hypothetical protein
LVNTECFESSRADLPISPTQSLLNNYDEVPIPLVHTALFLLHMILLMQSVSRILCFSGFILHLPLEYSPLVLSHRLPVVACDVGICVTVSLVGSERWGPLRLRVRARALFLYQEKECLHEMWKHQKFVNEACDHSETGKTPNHSFSNCIFFSVKQQSTKTRINTEGTPDT